MNDRVEVAYCDYMRALAHKGGATTKRLYGKDPRYYREVGRLGGRASVASRKAKIAALFGTIPIPEAPIYEPINSLPQTSHVNVRRPLTIADVRAECSRVGPGRAEVSERQRILDEMAEQTMARVLAQTRESHEDEPWDPWD